MLFSDWRSDVCSSDLSARLADLDVVPRGLAQAFDRLRGSSLSIAAQQLVPGWGQPARMSWLGSARGDLFWIHGVPQTAFLRKSQRLVRAMTTSFRELFRWRTDLNARARHDERHVPIDDRVASAIALISRESEQVHHGRSEEHTSELQSLMRISYAVFCLNKKINTHNQQ